jgi:hypothetical protein
VIGDEVSQRTSSDTDQSRVPPPEFDMCKVSVNKVVSPCWALKLKLGGLTAMVGGAWQPTTELASKRANPISRIEYHLGLFLILPYSFAFSHSTQSHF